MLGWQDFLAGWLAGICGLLVGQALDTIKVRQQIYNLTLYNTMKMIYQRQGLCGYYKGITFPIILVGPSNAVFFGVYGNFLRFLQGDTKSGSGRNRLDDPNWRSNVFYSGLLAGFFQVLVVTPGDLIKTKLQLQPKSGHRYSWLLKDNTTYKGMWDCIRQTYKNYGLKEIYKGLHVTLWRDVPTSGIFTLAYEEMLFYQYPYPFTFINKSKTVKEITAGGTAGIVSWITVIPLDVVKSRMQGDDPVNPRYRGIIDCFVKSYKDGGLSVFFKGTMAISARAFPSTAAVFVAYEYFLPLFRRLSYKDKNETNKIKS